MDDTSQNESRNGDWSEAEKRPTGSLVMKPVADALMEEAHRKKMAEYGITAGKKL